MPALLEMIPMKRLGDPLLVARAVELLAAPSATFITRPRRNRVDAHPGVAQGAGEDFGQRNNAALGGCIVGAGGGTAIMEIDVEEFDRVTSTNLRGTFVGCQTIGRYFSQRKVDPAAPAQSR
jgi:NAD(P)-dependent dehydrogenase (short-subunit alcohol dehydrogenase family)